MHHRDRNVRLTGRGLLVEACMVTFAIPGDSSAGLSGTENRSVSDSVTFWLARIGAVAAVTMARKANHMILVWSK